MDKEINEINIKIEKPEFYYRNIILCLIYIFKEKGYEINDDIIKSVLEENKKESFEGYEYIKSIINESDLNERFIQFKKEIKPILKMATINKNAFSYSLNDILKKYSYSSYGKLNGDSYTNYEAEFLDLIFNYCLIFEYAGEITIEDPRNLAKYIIFEDNRIDLYKKAIKVYEVEVKLTLS